MPDRAPRADVTGQGDPLLQSLTQPLAELFAELADGVTDDGGAPA